MFSLLNQSLHELFNINTVDLREELRFPKPGQILQAMQVLYTDTYSSFYLLSSLCSVRLLIIDNIILFLQAPALRAGPSSKGILCSVLCVIRDNF